MQSAFDLPQIKKLIDELVIVIVFVKPIRRGSVVIRSFSCFIISRMLVKITSVELPNDKQDYTDLLRLLNYSYVCSTMTLIIVLALV